MQYLWQVYIEFNVHPIRGAATMKWETPAYNDIRFGFEVTMYINNK
jgi:pyrroloquinoline quinone biosynthesis protein A